MSRRYQTDVYEDRREVDTGGRRDFYEDDEVDIRSTRSRPNRDRRSQPDFLREDYARTSAGPLVVRERERERDFDDTRSRRSHAPAGRSEFVEKEEVTYRGRREKPPPPPQDDREYEEVYYRRDSRGPPQPAPPPPKSARSVKGDETDVYIRREEIDERSVRGPPSRAGTARPPPSRAPPRSEYDETEEVRIRRTDDRRSTRGDSRERVTYRRSETELGRSGREVDREEILFRRSEREPPPPPPPVAVEKEEFVFRRAGGDDNRSRAGDDRRSRVGDDRRSRAPSRAGDIDDDSSVSLRPRDRSLPPPRLVAREREDFYFRRPRSPSPPPQPPSPPRIVEREQITYRQREPSLPPPPRREREEIIFRHREGPSPGPPPPPSVKSTRHETEEISFRRRDAPSRGRSMSSSRSGSPPVISKEEIVIRRTERSPSPVPQSPPPPALEPIIRRPIHQEIITHHRHIDHGMEQARRPTPPPSPSPPPRHEKMEIAIRRKEGTRSNYHEEEIRIERGGSPDSTTTRARSRSRGAASRRSSPAASTRSRRVTSGTAATSTSHALAVRDDLQAEADFYSRKAAERSFPGEAYNGATKDWAIVDVPPGTNRVRMDGAGGGAQEITWQRYNGVRRSNFYTDGQEYPGDFGYSPHSKRGPGPSPGRSNAPDMWTEITKDLVLKEAIETAGYEYEETDFFFYVMSYLRYEDVLRLVEISDGIRANRRNRIREIEWEREQLARDRIPPPPTQTQPVYDERIYEREVVYDRDRRR